MGGQASRQSPRVSMPITRKVQRVTTAWRVNVLVRAHNPTAFDAVIAEMLLKLPAVDAKLLGAGAGAGAVDAVGAVGAGAGAAQSQASRNGVGRGMVQATSASGPEIPHERRLLFVATDSASASASASASLPGAAKAVLLVSAARVEVDKRKPVGGTLASTYRQLSIKSHVNLISIATLAACRRQGAAAALVAALRLCMRANSMMITEAAACKVGDALSFWGSVGLQLGGAEGHPLPPPGSQGRDMPSEADRRTLYAEVGAVQWECGHCGHRSDHEKWVCSSKACGMHRPGRPQVLDLEVLGSRLAYRAVADGQGPSDEQEPSDDEEEAIEEDAQPAASGTRGQEPAKSQLAAKRLNGRSVCKSVGCSKAMHGLGDDLVGGFCTRSCRAAHYESLGQAVPHK